MTVLRIVYTGGYKHFFFSDCTLRYFSLEGKNSVLFTNSRLLYEKKVLSVHDRYQPFRRLPNMKSVRLNAVFRKVEMSEKLKSNFALFIFV